MRYFENQFCFHFSSPVPPIFFNLFRFLPFFWIQQFSWSVFTTVLFILFYFVSFSRIFKIRFFVIHFQFLPIYFSKFFDIFNYIIFSNFLFSYPNLPTPFHSCSFFQFVLVFNFFETLYNVIGWFLIHFQYIYFH